MINASRTNTCNCPADTFDSCQNDSSVFSSRKVLGCFERVDKSIQEQYVEFSHYLTRQVSSRTWDSILFHEDKPQGGRSIGHVAHMNASCRTYVCVVSHM